jgi:translation initiation factor 3 subunit L
MDNLSIIQQAANEDGEDSAWPIDQIYDYLYKLQNLGLEHSTKPVYVYFRIFATIALSRLECILCDYTGCLQALSPLVLEANHTVIEHQGVAGSDPTGAGLTGTTVNDILNSVMSAKISLTYHAGVSYMMIHRYHDATHVLNDLCLQLYRSFKSSGGSSQQQQGRSNNKYKDNKEASPNDQFMKQYDRMMALLAILLHVHQLQNQSSTTGSAGSSSGIDENLAAAIREKFATSSGGANATAVTRFDELNIGSYEELLQCPKFVSTDPFCNMHRHQVHLFLTSLEHHVLIPAANQNLRSYLKLYTSIPVAKLSKFHDLSQEAFVPLLLSHKLRTRQLERPRGAHLALKDSLEPETSSSEGTAADAYTTTYIDGAWSSTSTSGDIHYHVVTEDSTSIVHVDEAPKQRRFENYFVSQISQNADIVRLVKRINVTV